jgi:hypothetical protein
MPTSDIQPRVEERGKYDDIQGRPEQDVVFLWSGRVPEGIAFLP